MLSLKILHPHFQNFCYMIFKNLQSQGSLLTICDSQVTGIDKVVQSLKGIYFQSPESSAKFTYPQSMASRQHSGVLWFRGQLFQLGMWVCPLLVDPQYIGHSFNYSFMYTSILKFLLENFLAVKWLGFCTFTVKGTGSILHWGTKTPQPSWCGQNKNKKKIKNKIFTNIYTV